MWKLQNLNCLRTLNDGGTNLKKKIQLFRIAHDDNKIAQENFDQKYHNSRFYLGARMVKNIYY